MPADRGGAIIGETATPAAEVVAAAERAGCRSISYTYTEPTVFFEFALETARLARASGLRNVFVTNGYMTPEAIEMIAPVLDAANVDLKGFTQKYYKGICGADLEHVQETLRRMRAVGGLRGGDHADRPRAERRPRRARRRWPAFLVDDLGPDTPWHISRFHPTYRLTDRPPTPVETLHRAHAIGRAAGLRYVYVGNVPGDGGESTRCPGCGALLVERRGFRVGKMRLKDGRCPDCGTAIEGVWS